MSSPPEHTYECECCGHVHTERYGRFTEPDTEGHSMWLCHHCANILDLARERIRSVTNPQD